MHTVLGFLLLIATADSTDRTREVELLAAVEAYARPFDDQWIATRAHVEWADLTDDEFDDALVYLTGPTWCSTGGCTVIVFETMSGDDEEEWGRYRPAAEISMVHGPIGVGHRPVRGWADLIVEDVDGTLRTLSFDGETYPRSPGGGSIWSGPQPERTVFADTQ